MIDNMSRYRTNNTRSRPIPVKQYSNECPICMDPINPNSNVIITKCNHQFCATCLLHEMKNRHTCPVCRNNLMEKPKKVEGLTDDELRNIVIGNISYIPEGLLNITDKLIPLLKASKIPELFESDINIENELKEIEENILTTITFYGFYVATEIRRIMMSD